MARLNILLALGVLALSTIFLVSHAEEPAFDPICSGCSGSPIDQLNCCKQDYKPCCDSVTDFCGGNTTCSEHKDLAKYCCENMNDVNHACCDKMN